LNLMPESTLRWQSFNQKKPYIMAAVFSLVLVVAATGWLFSKLAAVKEAEFDTLHQQLVPLETRAEAFKRAFNRDLTTATNNLGQVTEWIQDRYYWADVCAELRRVLARVEEGSRQKLGVDTGVWIEKFTTKPGMGAGAGMMGFDPYSGGGAFTPNPGGYGYPTAGGGYPPRSMPSYELEMGGAIPPPMADPNAQPMMNPDGTPMLNPDGTQAMGTPVMNPDGTLAVNPDGTPMLTPVGGADSATEYAKVELILRAVDVSREAQQIIPFAVQGELNASPMFNPATTVLSPQVTPDEATTTFSFGVTLGLKKPLKR
jgi:hypothetical protein